MGLLLVRIAWAEKDHRIFPIFPKRYNAVYNSRTQTRHKHRQPEQGHITCQGPATGVKCRSQSPRSHDVITVTDDAHKVATPAAPASQNIFSRCCCWCCLLGILLLLFIIIWRKLPQVSFLSRDKHVIVATKHVFCRDKSMLVATNIILSWQNLCRDRRCVLLWQTQKLCRDKNDTCGSSRQW